MTRKRVCLAILVALLMGGCRSETEEISTGDAFLGLLREAAPRGQQLIREPDGTMQAEFNRLFYASVASEELSFFAELADWRNPLASSVAVFGIAEIAQRNYGPSQSAWERRRQALESIGDLLSHDDPDVRAAAIYAAGALRLNKHLPAIEDVLKSSKMTVSCSIECPPFFSGNGLGANLGGIAGCAKRMMEGKPPRQGDRQPSGGR